MNQGAIMHLVQSCASGGSADIKLNRNGAFWSYTKPYTYT